MLKSELRRKIRQLKRDYTEMQLRELSALPMRQLLAHERVKAAQTVLMYSSLPDEVYTPDALDRLAEAGKRVLLPVVTGDTTMRLHVYGSRNDMRAGAYGIMEPTGEVFDNLSAIDVAVVPGIAFDRNNNRMGRGKGYYDRFLASIPQAYKIGICFKFQLVDEIPAGQLDIKMDEIIV